MNILDDILSHYNDEIEFETNLKSQCMDGLVFLFNQCIHFTIYIMTTTDNANACRFEFRRTSGDAMVAAKFWSELKGLFERAICPQNVEQDDLFDFISLDLDTMRIDDDSDDDDMELEMELDELTQTLMENDLFVVDELIFLYEQMSANDNICNDILAHDGLMKQLVNKSMQNADICVVRIVLMILTKLAMIKGNNMIHMAQIDLFCNINLTLQNERQLIKKCAMKLLAALCGRSEWTMDENLRSALIENVKLCENECDEELMKKINANLMMHHVQYLNLVE